MSNTLYASIDGRVSPLANQEVVFHDPARDQTHVMTTQVLQAMDLCRPFRSLDQHVATLAGALQGVAGREDAVRRVLENLVTRGLLVSDESWIERLGRGGQREAAPFAGIFIHAGGAPESLRSLLDGLHAYEDSFAPGHRYVLLDDAADGSDAGERRRLLEAFGASAEVSTSYVGAESWARLGKTLGGLVQGSPGSFLLRRDAGGGGGGARNLAALLAAGRRFVLLDDGARLPFHRHADTQRGLDIAARLPADMGLDDSIDEALGSGQPLDDDPLQIHLRVCGAALGDLVNRVPGFELRREDISGLEPSRLSHLRAGSRVLATAAGVRGSLAAGPWLFALDGAVAAEFSADRDRYLRTLAEPMLHQVQPRVQLRVMGGLQALMIDNAEAAACAPASGERAERLQATLWRAMFPAALSAHFPMTLGVRGARRDTTWLKQPLEPGSNEFLADAVERAAPEVRAQAPWSRLVAVGARLRDLADASDSDLRTELREYLAFTRSGLIQSLQRVFDERGAAAPVHWQADVRQIIEANGRALMDDAEPRLADAGAEHSGQASLRAVLQRHAEAIDAWPDLWEASRARNESLWKSL